ncbi:MAG TPA: hypothetical protein PK511_00865 [Chitinophagales bacterium]|nr:hypothetical protein [Chitinophagales bacterium]HMX04061.1 hypothetical protein [Chitinophagales bacterium]HMZ88338.1 hypothetical protein [Chitinophagales bacterium]HNA56479.1 hypothetical protein [Chitinophagales bacterium]HNE44830.1 hypothetical protein [Chitinophagales bacterium]
MKKVTYFAFALALTVLVSCKGKSTAEEGDTTTTETTTVETGASENVDNAAQVDEVLNQSSDDELFGTDVDDAAVEGATTK